MKYNRGTILSIEHNYSQRYWRKIALRETTTVYYYFEKKPLLKPNDKIIYTTSVTGPGRSGNCNNPFIPWLKKIRIQRNSWSDYDIFMLKKYLQNPRYLGNDGKSNNHTATKMQQDGLFLNRSYYALDSKIRSIVGKKKKPSIRPLNLNENVFNL